MTKNEKIIVKQALILLHAEMHNPGACRYTNPNIDLDKLAEQAIRILS